MIHGPKYKICRRLGSGVFEKCQTQKFALSRGNRTKSNMKRPKALSDYGLQLLEKQKIRFYYGLSEKQFSNYVKEAILSKGVPSADRLHENLEKRLDNIIYRLGIASTRAFARQTVAHGHFMVNGKRVTAPSVRMKIGDSISVRPGSRVKPLFSNLDKKLKGVVTPSWLFFDPVAMEGKLQGKPEEKDAFLNFNSVIEFYSR